MIEKMAKIYEQLIINGRKTIDDVREDTKEATRALLIADGYTNLANTGRAEVTE